jgi:hypothetical protein
LPDYADFRTIRHSQLSLITDTIEGFHEFTPAAIAGLPFIFSLLR